MFLPVAVVMAGLLLLGRGPIATAEPTELEGVYFSEHVDYGGFTFRLTANRVDNLKGWRFNDKISSLRVVGPFTVTVFEHADLRGRRATFGSGSTCRDIRKRSYSSVYDTDGTYPCTAAPNWGPMLGNDQISSLVITRNPTSHPWGSFLHHPEGIWVAGTLNSAHRWIFCRNGGYRHRLISNKESFEMFGSSRLYENPAGPPFGRFLETKRNIKVPAVGKPEEVPDELYRFRYISDTAFAIIEGRVEIIYRFEDNPPGC